MTTEEVFKAHIPEEFAGERVDVAISHLFPDFSRSRLQKWLKDGHIQVDGSNPKPRGKVKGGERVEFHLVLEEETTWLAEDISLDIVFEDAHMLVVNKPAGMVVHPAAGNFSGTMLNALLYYAPELKNIPRAGIIHRLDKDTTGLLVVARSLSAQKKLVEQLQARSFVREYDAIVSGQLTAGGTVDEPIGRHPVNRKRMAVVQSGKEAITHYRVNRRYRSFTWLTVKLETGRTHQIRVHMAHIHHPLLGDPVYGGRFKIPPGCDESFIEVLKQFKRQALHAHRLGLVHPDSGEYMEWQAELHPDMQALVNALEADMSQHSGETA